MSNVKENMACDVCVCVCVCVCVRVRVRVRACMRACVRTRTPMYEDFVRIICCCQSLLTFFF